MNDDTASWWPDNQLSKSTERGNYCLEPDGPYHYHYVVLLNQKPVGRILHAPIDVGDTTGYMYSYSLHDGTTVLGPRRYLTADKCLLHLIRTYENRVKFH